MQEQEPLKQTYFRQVANLVSSSSRLVFCKNWENFIFALILIIILFIIIMCITIMTKFNYNTELKICGHITDKIDHRKLPIHKYSHLAYSSLTLAKSLMSASSTVVLTTESTVRICYLFKFMWTANIHNRYIVYKPTE